MLFLCASNLHPGRRVPGIPAHLNLDPERLSTSTAWDTLVETAIRERVDAILLAGNVIDRENRRFEPLGNSDELRAGVIVDAAIEISRKGRQVFYFTAQGDEVGRWKTRIERIPEESRPDVTIIDLAVVRQDAGFERLPMAVMQAPVDRLTIPPPDGMDRETYGTVIKAPGINVWDKGTGGIHLWHLIDDLPALHTLLEQDIRTWGQLSGIVRSSGIDGLVRLGVDGDILDTAEARARLLETAIAMWKIGHVRPLTLNGLAESGVVDHDTWTN